MLPASRVPPPSRRAPNWGSGRGAHLGTPSSSANHTAAASQPTGWIAKAASWLHLLRVSPALHPPERPSHTHSPKPAGFGGSGHVGEYVVHSSLPKEWCLKKNQNAPRPSELTLWPPAAFLTSAYYVRIQLKKTNAYCLSPFYIIPLFASL